MTFEEKRTAARTAAVHRIMAWTSANRRTLRWAVLALGAMFAVGVVLLFWAPLAGLLVMLAAGLAFIAMMLVPVALLVRGTPPKDRT
jgi:hypothetical protein